MKRRVVVTGIGVIAPNGIGKTAFWNALENGQSGIKNCTLFDAISVPNQVVGEVSDFRIVDFTDSKRVLTSGRACQMAVAAANLAIEDAKLSNGKNTKLKPSRKGVVFGTIYPSLDIFEEQVSYLLEKKAINPTQFNNFYSLLSPLPITMEIVQETGFDDFSMTINNACTSGLESIFYAANQIALNRADVCLCGGADAGLTPVLVNVFNVIGLSTQNSYDSPEKASRPFDKKRSGGVLSEGCAILVLEDLETALQRGAKIYGEIMGHSVHFKKKDENEEGTIYGMEKSMNEAIKMSNITKTDIDYISAHAPSSPVQDKLETIAIKRLFESYAYKIPVSSIKSMIGNPLAAAGPIQLSAVLMAITRGVIPPTINYEYPDPDCDLDYVPNHARKNNVTHALMETHGFDGTNAALVVKKYL